MLEDPFEQYRSHTVKISENENHARVENITMISAYQGPLTLKVSFPTITNCGDILDVCLHNGNGTCTEKLISSNCLYELNQSKDHNLIARYKNVTLTVRDKQEDAQYEDYEEVIQITQL